jgi:predicted nucleic acid-binding protein
VAHIVPDASFLAHALITSQLTITAQAEYIRAIADPTTRWTTSAAVYLEFGSLLRKMAIRKQLTQPEAQELFDILHDLPADRHHISSRLTARAWEIATVLGQTDVFDAFGLAVAEDVDGTLWTSDRRFFNAAAAFAPNRIEYIP